MTSNEGNGSVPFEGYLELDTPEALIDQIRESASDIVTPEVVEDILTTRGERPHSSRKALSELGVSYGYDPETSQMATKCLIKQEEASTFESLLSQVKTPEQISLVLRALRSWIPRSFPTLQSKGLVGYGIPKTALARSILKGASQVVTLNPDSLESVSSDINELFTANDDFTTIKIKEQFTGYRVAGTVASRSGAESILGDYSEAAVAILSSLTDLGLLSAEFWCKEGLDRLPSDPNFFFYEEFHNYLQKNPDFLARIGEERCFKAASYLVFNILQDISLEDRRHQANARQLIAILEAGVGKAQKQLPLNSVIQLANVISDSLNNRDAEVALETGVEKPKLSKLDPQDLTEIGQAFGRLLSITRSSTDQNVTEFQAYEDRMYAEILEELISRALKKHARSPQNVSDLLMRYPDVTESELSSLVSLYKEGVDPDKIIQDYHSTKAVASKPRRVSWNIRRPGYGILS